MGDSSHIHLTGGDIEYRWFGRSNSGLTLVLLHEGLGCVDLWRDFPELLATATGCRVLAYSRHGYGRSAACALPRPISYMHDDARDVLPELLAGLGVGAHLLIGHSDGGSIALINAGTVAGPDLKGVVTMAAHIFIEDISVQSIAAANSAYASGKLRDALARFHGPNVDCAFRGWADSWLNPAFKHWNLEEFLPAIRVPCLIMQGVDDAYGTAAQVDRIVAGIRRGTGAGAAAEAEAEGNVQALMLPDCGHAPQQDQPAATLSAIGAFVATIAAKIDPA